MPKTLILLVILSLLPCFHAEPQTAKTVKIGVFLSLTGSTAGYGVSALNAIKLATDEANRGGGIGGKQIKFARPDVIFAPGSYTTAPMVARFVKERGVKSTLIGSDGWDSPELMKDGAAHFDGVYFANHFWVGRNDPLVQQFVTNYQNKYGAAPDAGAATAYDAARLLFAAFTRAKSTEHSAVRDALATTKDFPGVTGKITIDANRNAQGPVYLLRIDKNGRFSLQ